jgi:predicted RNA-binding Zn ribbon-like protein
MKNISPVKIEEHQFAASDFIGGDAALDFVNTVTGRDQAPRDWLDSYSRLLEWAAKVQLLPQSTLRDLARRARGSPAAAKSALGRAKKLREALFHLTKAVVAGEAPTKAALAMLREHWIKGTEAHDLRFADDRVFAALRNDAADLDLVAAMIAYRMVQNVLATPAGRLRICQGPNCSWLFIDSSKAGRRRWCDMAVCGNAAKSRRFLARAKRRH